MPGGRRHSCDRADPGGGGQGGNPGADRQWWLNAIGLGAVLCAVGLVVARSCAGILAPASCRVGAASRTGTQQPFRPNLRVASVAPPWAADADAAAAAVPVVGFYFPGREIAVDRGCNAAFLGNFWTPAAILNFAPPGHAGDEHGFLCSEAAFWASQWWELARRFEGLDGQAVFELARNLTNSPGVAAPDPAFGGFGAAWPAMRAILQVKFAPGTALAAGLLATRDAFLIEHQEGIDLDADWSDFCDGSGENWLGLQLMLQRDALVAQAQGGTAPGVATGGRWTAFIRSAFSISTGATTDPDAKARWLGLVRAGALGLNAALPYTCPPRRPKG